MDPELFAETLPASMIEPWITQWQQEFALALTNKLSPDQLSQIANGIRSHTENDSLFEDLNSNDLAVVMQAIGSEVFQTELENAMVISVSMLGAQMTVTKEMKRSIPPLTEDPYIADILEIDGIFGFPNRIWRRDLIASIRRGS